MPEPTTLDQTRIAEMQALANRGRHQSGWGFAYHRDVSTLLAENTELQAILDAGEENYRGILAEERTALIQRADKAEAALARLQAENTELHKRVTEAEAFFLFGAMNRMVDHGTREIMERVDQAEAEVSRLNAERDEAQRALKAALLDPPVWHREPLYQRVERECWKQHAVDFQDCEEPACLLLKRLAGLVNWTVDMNGVNQPTTTPSPPPPVR